MILVVNAGSSNVKFAIYDPVSLVALHREQVNTMQNVLDWIEAHQVNLTAVGHRIVHGGKNFFAPVLLTESVIEQLKTLVPLAPLHQPHNIAAVEILATKYPSIKQVGCFDTAFHTTQAKLAKLFAIPNDLTAAGVIRYGFHGLSYEYIASVLESKIGSAANKKVIVAHLGNGASMCAMQECRSVATSMGFSALEGLMMGTRSGSIDPGVLLYLQQEKKFNADQLADFLYNKCGLLGVSGISNDMQTLLNNNDANSQLAIDLFCYRAACEIGKLMVVLKGCDAIVFTAGIGEHAPLVREKIISWLDWQDVKIDSQQNNTNATIISAAKSKILVVVIPTNEESVIVQHTKQLLSAGPPLR